MAPHNISLADRLDEIYEKIEKLEKEIEINHDLQEFLDEQIINTRWELTNIRLQYELVHPDSYEHNQLQRKERRLRKSCDSATKRIEELKTENIELKRRCRQLNAEMEQMKR